MLANDHLQDTTADEDEGAIRDVSPLVSGEELYGGGVGDLGLAVTGGSSGGFVPSGPE